MSGTRMSTLLSYAPLCDVRYWDMSTMSLKLCYCTYRPRSSYPTSSTETATLSSYAAPMRCPVLGYGTMNLKLDMDVTSAQRPSRTSCSTIRYSVPDIAQGLRRPGFHHTLLSRRSVCR
eukprot:1558664-Rhodomonas_salina.5